MRFLLPVFFCLFQDDLVYFPSTFIFHAGLLFSLQVPYFRNRVFILFTGFSFSLDSFIFYSFKILFGGL